MKTTKSKLLFAVVACFLLTMLLSCASALVLRSGDKGDDVTRMQTALVSQGFLEEKSAKGKFDKKTVSALKNFQAAQGLEETGAADVRTLTRLLGAEALGMAEQLPPPAQDEGQAVLLGIYGLTPGENGDYLLSSVMDQAVIDLYHTKDKLQAVAISVDFDTRMIEISLTLPKGASAKKAKTACEKAASLLGDLMAEYGGKGYEASNPKGKKNNHFGGCYDEYSLKLNGFSSKGESLCYGVKQSGHSLAWRPDR